jgi:hypothetical protein
VGLRARAACRCRNWYWSGCTLQIDTLSCTSCGLIESSCPILIARLIVSSMLAQGRRVRNNQSIKSNSGGAACCFVLCLSSGDQ